MSYDYLGSMTTRYGHREDVVRILLSAVDGLREIGCELYLVGVSDTDPNVIWVTEVWQSREHHAASLRLPETRAAIEQAMPLLTGEFTRQELTMLGGLGLPAAD